MRAENWLVVVAILLAGCGGGGGGGDGTTDGAPLVLAAGPTAIEPASVDDWSGGIDTERLGVERVDAVYDLTTPAGEPFAFDVLCRGEGNTGEVVVGLAHARDGDTTPAGDATTMAAAGLVASGAGTVTRDAWVEAHGDGFARVTVRGEVDRDQVIAVRTGDDDGVTTALVRIRVGPESPINVAARPRSEDPAVVDDVTIYSSDSWMFGLPTIAVSGDRTSIVCYDGDRASARRMDRYEVRLQLDGATGSVTGGGSEEASLDSGNWRDHEIAALYNVLALVRSGTDTVDVWLSLDRGATFGQKRSIPVGSGARMPGRLVQAAMALDYSLAVLYWRTGEGGASELMIVEGRPSALDGGGSPTAFVLDPPEVLRRAAGDVSPLLMSAAWSAGGDLVVGYAYSTFRSRPDATWESRTVNRCAVRLHGSDAWADTIVEEDVVVGRDPSVSLVGSGITMRIFYAYEGRDGVRLRTSEDAGATWSDPVRIDDGTSHTPTVIARAGPGGTRVDLLHLVAGEAGTELHRMHWTDFDTAAPDSWCLVRSRMEPVEDLPPGTPVPGAEPWDLLPVAGCRVTEVAWFGYDAVVEDDRIVVVVDEVTWFSYYGFVGPPLDDFRGGVMEGDTAAGAGDFVPAEPPPLAPGMTDPVPPPDPDHMHRLRVLRIE